jgi:signal transduction histidine kinase
VFEPFWQVDRSQRTRDGGTGLGLAVVKQIVELLGGRASVTSVLGDGSIFEIRLPRESH